MRTGPLLIWLAAVLAGCASSALRTRVRNEPVPSATCAPERGLAAAPFPGETGVYRTGPLTLVVDDDLAQHPASSGEAIVVLTGGRPVVLSVDPSSAVRAALYYTSPRNLELPPTITNGQPAVRFPVCGRRVRRFGGGIVFAGIGCARLRVQPAGEPAQTLLIPVGNSLRGCPPASRQLAPAALPFLGVACEVPNSIVCDRIGVGVHFGRPASLITVQIDGRLVTLSPPTDPPDNLWLGYLWSAGLRRGPLGLHIAPYARLWFGQPMVFPKVRVTALLSDGRAAASTASVMLHPGFG